MGEVVRIGCHVSMNFSQTGAEETGSDIVQLHLGSPRKWRDTRIPSRLPKVPFYVHSPYMINLSSKKHGGDSANLMMHQAKVASEIGCLGLVVHGGSYKDGTLESALSQWQYVFSQEYPLPILVENAANGKFSPTRYCNEFFQLMKTADLFDRADVGWCLDTAHLWGASADPDFQLSQMLYYMGPPSLIHANGSTAEKGSGMDIHSPLAHSIAPADWVVHCIKECSTQDVIVESRDPKEDVSWLRSQLQWQAG